MFACVRSTAIAAIIKSFSNANMTTCCVVEAYSQLFSASASYYVTSTLNEGIVMHKTSECDSGEGIQSYHFPNDIPTRGASCPALSLCQLLELGVCQMSIHGWCILVTSPFRTRTRCSGTFFTYHVMV